MCVSQAAVHLSEVVCCCRAKIDITELAPQTPKHAPVAVCRRLTQYVLSSAKCQMLNSVAVGATRTFRDARNTHILSIAGIYSQRFTSPHAAVQEGALFVTDDEIRASQYVIIIF